MNRATLFNNWNCWNFHHYLTVQKTRLKLFCSCVIRRSPAPDEHRICLFATMLFLVYYIGRYANEISVFFNLRVVSKSPAEISTPIKLSRKFALFSKSVPLVYSVSTVPFIVMQFF